MNSIGNRIKTTRKNKGLTQQQLAQRLGVTKALISAYENLTRKPSLDILVRLSNILNCSTDYILGVDNEKRISLKGLSENQVKIIENLIKEFNK